jgi:hypothetical protein
MAHPFTVITGAGAAVARAANQDAEPVPAKNYSVIRLVGAFGFYACLILLAFSVVALRDINVAGLTLAGVLGFGVVWLFGAIEMRLIMVDEALRRMAP